MAIINGTGGDDKDLNSLIGTNADDQIFGFAGNDYIFGSLGLDLIDGGDDYDVAIYDGALFNSGVFINNTGSAVTETWNGVSTTVGPFGVDKAGLGTDSLVGIESFNASQGNDIVYLSDPVTGNAYVFDRAGDDKIVADQTPGSGHVVFYAGSGNDQYIGSIGNVDRIDYRTGGIDNIDAAGPQIHGAVVTFTGIGTGFATDPWGNTDTFSGVEAITGSDLNDTLHGGPGNDFLDGAGGEDEINGNGGFDNISGGDGSDILRGGADGDIISGGEGNDYVEGDYFLQTGNDSLSGEGGDDYFAPGFGNDTIDGGSGRDVVFYDYWGLTNGVTVNNTSTIQDGVAPFTTDKRGFGTDSLSNVEAFHGTEWDDIIHVGGMGGSWSFDRGGDDLVIASQDPNADGHNFRAGSGNDTYVGTVSRDTVDYSDDGYDNFGLIFQGVTVDLAAGTATDGWGGTDSLTSVESVTGTRFDDIILGNGDRNDLRGLEGNDTLDGRGGDDDRVRYNWDPSGVDVNLTTGVAIDGWGDTDTLLNIEDVDGSEFDDTLVGDGANNKLKGRDGDDLIEGADGDDFAVGGQGADTIDGGAGFDHASYDDDWEHGGNSGININLAAGIGTDGFGDTDTLIDIEGVSGTPFADTIIGNAEDNYLEGGAGDDNIQGLDGRDTLLGSQGNDTLDGGDQPFQYSGGDEVRYDREHEYGGTLGIVVDLAAGTATDTFGDTDTLIGIESIRGSIFDDSISGGTADERLSGGDGNDTLNGNDGNDDLSGGSGNDELDGGVGGDFLQPGTGDDTVIGGANGPLNETDTLSYIFDSMDAATLSGINVNFTGEFDGTIIDYGGGTDLFSGIETVGGTNNADQFQGADGDQTFLGFGGDDTFAGGAGDRDRVDYSRDAADVGSAEVGINVDLGAGTGTDTYGDTDSFSGIEEIRGSQFNDVIIGDGNRNDLQGEDGDDVIDSVGGQGNYLDGGRGDDTITANGDGDFVRGGDGNDLITFYGIGGGVNPGLGSDTIVGGTDGFFSIEYTGIGETVIIDTALGTTQLAGGDIDLFSNIRNVRGGDGDDELYGDDVNDRQEFFTSLGDDYIDGRGGGRDWLIYDNQAETSITVNFLTGTAVGTYAGSDSFVNIEAVRGTSGDDVFIGGTQAYTEYQGLDGVDSYTGGTGEDRISFSFDDDRGGLGAVTVDLGAGTAIDGFGNTETFTSIEQVTATEFDDTLLGSAGANVLIGLGGNDTIDAQAGDDHIFAGGGADTVAGGAGADEFGGRIWELDGDTITDLSLLDRITVFDNDFNVIAADLQIVGNELQIDTTGDGLAEATMFLTNGYNGPVESTGGPVGGPIATVISVEDAGYYGVTITEDTQTLDIEVTRSGDIFTTATVDVTVSGTGLNAADASDISSTYEGIETVTFLPGEVTKTVSVTISEDTDVEPAEDLVVSLSNPTSDGALPAEIGGSETYIRILNDDVSPTVSVSGEKAIEDSGVITFTVERTGDTSQEIEVPYILRSAGGLQGAESDDLVGGLDQSGVIIIAAGETTAALDVAISVDTDAELHDDIILSISSDPTWPADLTIGTREATGSIRNDDGIPPAPPVGATASNWGDPHIVTLDGLGYDFQAVGEFTLLEAASGDPLSIQVRFQPVDGSDIASETTAVATSIGTARVVIDVDASSLVKVDGVDFDLSTAIGGTSVGDGQIYYDGESITLVYANGEQLLVDLHDGFLNTSVALLPGRDVGGLLGDGDGDSSNDLALSDGTILPQPVSFTDLYGAFADSWRISDALSLFDYEPGQGTADFTDASFPSGVLSLDDIPESLLAPLLEAFADFSDPVAREAAILDALLTGDVLGVLDSADAADTAQVATAPTDAPVIASGVGVVGSQFEVVEGNDGTQSLVFTIYRTGDSSTTLDVGYQFSGTVDGADVTDLSGGTLNFLEGEAVKLVEIGIVGDSQFEANEDIAIEISVTNGTATSINSSFSVTIFDDDSQPPIIANEILGTEGNDFLAGTDEDDIITSLGGDFDFIVGGDGADHFVFGEEALNGSRERDLISDFEVGIDAIVLQDGASVQSIKEVGHGVVVRLEGDGDMIIVNGEGVTAENLDFLDGNDFLLA